MLFLFQNPTLKSVDVFLQIFSVLALFEAGIKWVLFTGLIQLDLS